MNIVTTISGDWALCWYSWLQITKYLNWFKGKREFTASCTGGSRGVEFRLYEVASVTLLGLTSFFLSLFPLSPFYYISFAFLCVLISSLLQKKWTSFTQLEKLTMLVECQEKERTFQFWWYQSLGRTLIDQACVMCSSKKGGRIEQLWLSTPPRSLKYRKGKSSKRKWGVDSITELKG